MLGAVSETPPPYAQYPRGVEPAAGSAAQLQSLMEGYYTYSWLFLANIVVSLIVFFGLGASRIPYAVLAGYVIVPLIFGFGTYPSNKKIGYGANWSPAQPVIASVLMGINSVTCGIVGYAVMQSIAINHIKRFGVRSGCLGMRKKAIRDRIAELESAEGSMPGAYPRP